MLREKYETHYLQRKASSDNPVRYFYSPHSHWSVYQNTGPDFINIASNPVYHLGGTAFGGPSWMFKRALYIIVGLMGVPVFTEGGGLGYILRPSFGYIIGFCIGAFITGKIAQKACKPSYGRLLLAGFSGMAAIYLCGLLYYYVICNYVINTPIAVWPLFLHCFIMVVPGDVALCFLSAYLALRLKRHVEKIIGLDTMNRN